MNFLQPQHREVVPVRIKLPASIQPNFVPPPGKAGEYTNKIHHIKMYLLEELPHHDFSLPFMEPVDTEALKVPSYYTVIEHPMDMGTIIKRVENNYYHNVNELVYDIRLVISNCFKFNMPGSLVYRNGQELEELFKQVYDSLPKGEEVPCSKEQAEKSLTMHQCRCRLRRVREETDDLEQDAHELFAEKWLPVAIDLNNQNIKALEDFDARLHNILKHCKEHSKRILDTYDYESSRIREEQANKGAENANDELDYSLRECQKPPFDWEDSLIDSLDDTLMCLRQDLAKSRRREQQKDKLGYSECLLPIFINAQIIAEGLCSQTHMPDSSDEDETDQDTVDAMERELIRKQFSKLILESKYDVMHIIEQVEYRSDRKYNMVNFSPKTISLLKKAIMGHHIRMEAEASAQAMCNSECEFTTSDDNPCGYSLPPVPKPCCFPIETMSDGTDVGLSSVSDSDVDSYRYSDSSEGCDE